MTFVGHLGFESRHPSMCRYQLLAILADLRATFFNRLLY